MGNIYVSKVFVLNLTLKDLRGTVLWPEWTKTPENRRDKRFITRAVLIPLDIFVFAVFRMLCYIYIYTYILRCQGMNRKL